MLPIHLEETIHKWSIEFLDYMSHDLNDSYKRIFNRNSVHFCNDHIFARRLKATTIIQYQSKYTLSEKERHEIDVCFERVAYQYKPYWL